VCVRASLTACHHTSAYLRKAREAGAAASWRGEDYRLSNLKIVLPTHVLAVFVLQLARKVDEID
jgi:hypothetical protein